MIWTGLLLGAFIVFHLFHFTIRSVPGLEIVQVQELSGRFDVFAMVAGAFGKAVTAVVYVVAMVIALPPPDARHPEHLPVDRPEQPEDHARLRQVRHGPLRDLPRRLRRHPRRHLSSASSPSKGNHRDPRRQGTYRQDPGLLGQAPLRLAEAGQPGQQAQVQGPRGRHRPGRRLGGGLAGRARLPGGGVLLPGQPPPRPLASPPRAASTPPRTTRTTATASTGSSTTPSRAATSAPARPTSSAWPRSATTSSTSAWPRACPSPVTTPATSTTAPSAAPRSPAPSTRAARPASSSCWAPTRPSRARSALGTVKMFPRTEMLDLVVVDGEAKGITVRDLVTGEIRSHVGDAVVLATGGYVNVFYLSTNAMGCSVTAIWKAHKKGAYFANPCYTQIHPTCIPQAGRLPVEADADVGVAPQRRPHLGPEEEGGLRQAARRDPRGGPRLLPRAEVPVLRQPGPARHRLARGQGAVRRGARRRARAAAASTSTSRTPSSGSARAPSASGTATSSRCTSGSPTRTPTSVPMRIYPAPHYAMGGLWVDYNLMSNIPGLFVLGEANFSDHGANRLGASALMQGLADGYFVIPYTIANYLAQTKPGKVKADHAGVRQVDRRGEGGARPAPRHQRQEDGHRVHARARRADVEQRRHGAQRGVAHRDARRRSRPSARSSGRTSR